MKKHPFNRWGHITSFSVDGMIDSYSTVELTATAPATPEILGAISQWMKNGSGDLPIWAEEWMCLYCGSPQPLPLTHCKKCGAPRNWILG